MVTEVGVESILLRHTQLARLDQRGRAVHRGQEDEEQELRVRTQLEPAQSVERELLASLSGHDLDLLGILGDLLGQLVRLIEVPGALVLGEGGRPQERTLLGDGRLDGVAKRLGRFVLASDELDRHVLSGGK